MPCLCLPRLYEVQRDRSKSMLPETLVVNDYCGRVDKEVAPSNAIDLSEGVIIVCAAG